MAQHGTPCLGKERVAQDGQDRDGNEGDDVDDEEDGVDDGYGAVGVWKSMEYEPHHTRRHCYGILQDVSRVL